MGKVWVNGIENAAPGAGTSLTKIVVSAGKIGRVYGFRVVSQEVNAAGKIWRLRASIQAQVVNLATVDVINPSFIDPTNTPLGIIKGNGVDFFDVDNVVVGTASTIHQANILYEEVDDPAVIRQGQIVATS